MSHPNRYTPATRWSGVAWPEQPVPLHPHDLNDLGAITRQTIKGLGDAMFRDGHIVSGASIAVDVAAGVVRLGDARIYAAGQVHEVAAATLPIAMDGRILVGISITRTVETHLENPRLAGEILNTRAQGEPGADRLVVTAAWSTDGPEWYSVHLVDNGTAILPGTQTSEYLDLLAEHDRESEGHRIIRGCQVTALGIVDGKQTFSIADGVVNVWGYRKRFDTARQYAITEDPELLRIEAEPHRVALDAPATITIPLNAGPVAAIEQVILQRTVDTSVTHGPYAGASDALWHQSIVEIVSISQAGVTYVAGRDYTLTRDAVNWSASGAGSLEPAPGSTYQIVYRYLDIVAPDASTESTITVTGATPGSLVLVTYTYKLPRIDALAIDRLGQLHYIKGTASRSNPWPPRLQKELFALAFVRNRWGQVPDIIEQKARAYHVNQMQALHDRVEDILDLVAQERLRRDMTSRDVAAKRGLFVDPFNDDDMRDQGIAQTGAIVGGALRLPIAVNQETRVLSPMPILLPYVEEVVIDQPLSTASKRINEYQRFDPLPGSLVLDPAVDFWTTTDTQWASDETRILDETVRLGDTAISEFGLISDGRNTWRNETATTVDVVEVARTQRNAEFLRVRSIAYTLDGFGAGEILDRLTFDGVDITPTPHLVANANGRIVGSFQIPTGLPAGTKLVEATGRAGTMARGAYTGSGSIDIRTLQRVVTTRMWSSLLWSEPDPIAQTFRLPAGRHITSVDVKFATIADRANHVVLQLRDADRAGPTTGVLGEGILLMDGVSTEAMTRVALRSPGYVAADTLQALVFLTDDGLHALSTARLGDFDATAQRFVRSNPYTGGELLTSASQAAWTAHQGEDLTCTIYAARFTATTRAVDCGQWPLVGVTDLCVLAAVELPTVDTSATVVVTIPGRAPYRVRPGQPIRFDESVTATATIAIELVGTALASPVLFPIIQVLRGVLAPSGDYVTRAMPAGPDMRLSVTFDASLPGASTAVVEAAATGGAWQALTFEAATSLGDGLVERTYRLTGWSANDARIRLTLSGTPRDRPEIRELRCAVLADPTNITA